MATFANDRRAIRTVRLASPDDFEGWREAARALALIGAAPSEVTWEVADGPADLFGAPTPAPPAPPGLFSVPRRFLALARQVIHHKDPERFGLLYAMLVRLRERSDALADKADPLVRRLETMAGAVRRGVSGAIGRGRARWSRQGP